MTVHKFLNRLSCVLFKRPVATMPFLHLRASVIMRILHPILQQGVRAIHVYSVCHQINQATQITRKLLRLFAAASHKHVTHSYGVCCSFGGKGLQYHLVSSKGARGLDARSTRAGKIMWFPKVFTSVRKSVNSISRNFKDVGWEVRLIFQSPRENLNL